MDDTIFLTFFHFIGLGLFRSNLTLYAHCRMVFGVISCLGKHASPRAGGFSFEFLFGE